MHISVFLLFLFMDSTLNLKLGDFGTLAACYKNNSLRLDCFYTPCERSPSYVCKFTASTGLLAANTSNNCKPVLPDHRLQYFNQITSYNCTLTRRGKKYVKHITIDYSKGKG
ncbi:hypothetical protein PBY51_009981 [Eleginops maclovinus]|uniref:Uncharacterized protein n=1 Tax=Eleginops maclovinus TaxID=56733 RepID=A0AAN7XXA9_ELEMC|nr:hypothetical protein PBY51_009981 [Eleginops maclovinus]